MAFLVRRIAGAFYLLPIIRMDAINKDAHTVLKAAYARHQPRPRYSRAEPYHLGWTFDVAVIVTLLIAVAGCLTA